MLTLPSTVRIHLAAKAVDFRKGHHGLFGLVRNELEGDPLLQVWVFYNARRTDLKVLWFEHGGFVLAHKKLARGRFRGIQSPGAVAYAGRPGDLGTMSPASTASRQFSGVSS